MKGRNMISKLFKNKKKRYVNLLLVLLPFIILIGGFGYMAVNSAKNIVSGSDGTPTFSNSIDTMDYHLRANATSYQKELFKELSQAVLDEDDEITASYVVKNFVADYYTWTNKSGSYDIGGMYYVYSPSKVNIIIQSRDTFYRYLSMYIREYGSDDLLEVTEVITEGGVAEKQYTYEGKTYDTYFYTCNWKYKETEKFDKSNFITKAYFTVIKNGDGRFEIVQSFGDR